MSPWFTEKEPTQTKEGLQVRYCLNCHGTYSETGAPVEYREERAVPALGHEHTLEYVEAKAATCQEEGYLAHYVCVGGETPGDLGDGEEFEGAGCGALFLDEEGTQLTSEQEITTPIGDHSWGDWVESEKNDPNAPYVRKYRECKICEQGYDEQSFPAESHTEHTLVFVEATAPTCYFDGVKAHYICTASDDSGMETGCGCFFADEEGTQWLSRDDIVDPATGHRGTVTQEVTANGHSWYCEACGYSRFVQHSYVLPGRAAEECFIVCFRCEEDDEGYKQSCGVAHSYEEPLPCDDRWQHHLVCSNGCGYEVIEDHVFGPWQYNSNDGHYRSCTDCGAQEQTAAHVWDEGTVNVQNGRVTYTCVAVGCGVKKTEFLRCFHACFTCGNCTAEETCPGKEKCLHGGAAVELPLIDPVVITNDPQAAPYLGDILVKEADNPLDPDAKPGQEIPEAYSGYTVDIKEIPLSAEYPQYESAYYNPYTQFALEAMEGYEPEYLFDIHLLDAEKNVVDTDGTIQVLVKLQLEESVVTDLQKGLLRLAHVTETGVVYYGKGGVPFYRLRDGEAWFWADSFSPFALVKQEAVYYGRSALAGLANGDSLVLAYDALVEGVETSQEKIKIYDNTHSITRDEARVVMDAYTRDHTEHFWLDSKYSMVYTKATALSPEKVKYIKPTYTMSGAELAAAKLAFEQAADAMLAGVAQMSDFDKQVVLHDRLADAVVYDYSFAQPDIYNAYGALVRGKAVCQGYAEALQYLLRRVGIQSFIVTGFSVNTQGETVSHAWNQVKMGDTYYHTDLTWNDQISSEGGYLYHAYFNVSDSYIQEDHSINVSAYPLKECGVMADNYFVVKDLTRNSFTADDLATLLAANDYQVSLLVYGGASNTQDFVDWLGANYQAVAGSIGITGQYSYQCSWLGREVAVAFNFAKPGVAVSAAVSGSKVNVQVAVENAGNVACDLAVAVYDSNEKLLGICYKPDQTMNGTPKTVSVSFRGGTPAKVKTFVLGSGSLPLFKAIGTVLH